MKSTAERFTEIAARILPGHQELHFLPPGVESSEQIDDYFFTLDEYLGGMAFAVLAMIEGGKK